MYHVLASSLFSLAPLFPPVERIDWVYRVPLWDGEQVGRAFVGSLHFLIFSLSTCSLKRRVRAPTCNPSELQ